MASYLSNHISNHFSEHIKVISDTEKEVNAKIGMIMKLILECLSNDRTLFLCGNGGSASDSQHIAAELIGRFSSNRNPLRAIALNTDTSVITCISNDFSYKEIFSRQLEGLGKRQDVLLALSTSGDSENVNLAIKQANHMGINSIALLGKCGGEALRLANLSILVPSDSTARIQETHILIGHIICDLIEKELDLV